jgi:sec-independent protein translocase protein TatC
MEFKDIIDNYKVLVSLLKRILLVFLIFFVSVLFFTYRIFRFDSINIYYPYPDFFHSFSISFFLYIKNTTLAHGLILININPFDLIFVDIYSGLALALIFSAPFILYFTIKYLSPAMYKKEKKAIIYIILPSILLFLLGAAFAYYIILPLLFRVVLIFASDLNVIPTMSVLGFFTLVVKIIILTGLSFEMPVIIVFLSYIGLVSPQTWLKNWKYAVVVSFFIALLVSPGATGGLIESMIGLILSGLYIAGALISRIVYKK